MLSNPELGCVNRCQLHVLDRNPHSLSAHGWLEDVSKVKKYTMSDADYEKREGTYRAYQQQMRKVGRDWRFHATSCRKLAKIVSSIATSRLLVARLVSVPWPLGCMRKSRKGVERQASDIHLENVRRGP